MTPFLYSHTCFRHDFILTYVIYSTIGFLINCLLIIGSHIKHCTSLYIWMFLTRFLTLFCFGYIIYFVKIVSNPEFTSDIFYNLSVGLTIFETMEIFLYTYGFFVAIKATNQINEEQTAENYFQVTQSRRSTVKILVRYVRNRVRKHI